MIYLTFGVQVGVILILLGYLLIVQSKYHQAVREMNAHLMEREQKWQEERQDLYNRIQSSNYAEYTAAEVKKIKAQKEEEATQYNLL